MAYRIASLTEVRAKEPPRKSKRYLAWLHELPCIITHTTPVEAAHVSFANTEYGASGRGKSQKASDRWALPLSPAKHRDQHSRNEQEFWRCHGINPHHVGSVLWGLWNEDKGTATQRATRLIVSGVFAKRIKET